MLFDNVFKEIEGLARNNKGVTIEKIKVWITNDKRGCTMSLKAKGVLITIPVEPLSPYIKTGEKTDIVYDGFMEV